MHVRNAKPITLNGHSMQKWYELDYTGITWKVLVQG